MAQQIKQGSTAYELSFFLTDSSDHITGATGKTPTVVIKKRGGSFASPSGSVTEDANGWYKVAGNATDSNTLGQILLHATASGADPTDIIAAEVVAYDPQDADALGLADVQGISSSFSSVDTALSAIAGYIDTEVAAIKAKTDNLPADPADVSDIPLASENASAVMAAVVEGTVTLVQSIRLLNSVLGAIVSGMDTGLPVFRDLADTKDRVSAVTDSYGNRSAVTRDLT